MFRHPGLALLIAALSLAAGAQNWSEARTEHFSVVSSMGDNRTVAEAQNIEQMRDVLGDLLARRDINVAAPTYVLLFASQDEMSKTLGTAPGEDAVANTSPDAAFFAFDSSSDAARTKFLLKFGRYLLATNYPRTPPWFDDGLPEYFSTARISDQINVTIGAPTRAVSDALHGEWIPLEQVLSAGDDSPLRAKPQFRAEAWAIVRYIFAQNKLGETGQYFGLTQNQGIAPAEALQQAFGMPPAQFEQAVRAAVLGAPARPAKQDAPAAPVATSIKVYEETPADLAALAADYRLHAAPSDADLQALQALLEKGPNIAVLRTLGYGYLQRNDYARATDALKRAAALDSKDLRAQYYLGRIAQEQSQQTFGALDARTPLQLAIVAFPDFADAHYLLGLALLDSTNPADGIRALQAAVKLAPRDDRYSLALANAYLQVREFDRGEAILDRIARSPDRQIAAEAARRLAAIPALKTAPPKSQIDTSIYRYNEKQWGEAGDKIPSLDELDTEAQKREAEAKAEEPDSRPVKYVTGTLLSVDCTQAPAATLTVVIATKPVTFYAADRKRLAVIGAHELSCALKNRRVALNYRPGSHQADNDLVSVELK